MHVRQSEGGWRSEGSEYETLGDGRCLTTHMQIPAFAGMTGGGV